MDQFLHVYNNWLLWLDIPFWAIFKVKISICYENQSSTFILYIFFYINLQILSSYTISIQKYLYSTILQIPVIRRLISQVISFFICCMFITVWLYVFCLLGMEAHDHIAALDDSKTSWNLKVRVTRIWVKCYRSGSVFRYNMILLDCLVIYDKNLLCLPLQYDSLRLFGNLWQKST